MKRQFITCGVGKTPAVALVDPKYPHNAAGVLRTCAAFGMEQLWISGSRVFDEWTAHGRLHREERMKAYGSVDVCRGDYFYDAFERDVTPVAVEVRENAELLTDFVHPGKALYVFGPEDGGLGKVHLRHCHRVVIIPSRHCLNLASAVSVVLADRVMKRQRDGLEPRQASYTTLDEQRGLADTDAHLTWVS